MKLARRRPPSAGQPTTTEPPRGAPVATFAGVLDGRTLWLAVEARPGTLALRDPATGEVVVPVSDLTDDQPEHRSIRVDLARLGDDDGTGEAAYDVVLVPAAGREPLRVWSPPRPAVPTPAGGDARWDVVRDDEGFLRLRRTALPPAAVLTGVTADDDGVRLTTEPAGDGALTGGDEVVASFAGVLDVAAVAATPAGRWRVEVGGRPVRRRADDLADPGRAAPMPELYDGDHRRLQLRWTDGGLLEAEVLDPDPEAGGDSGGQTDGEGDA